MLDAIMVLSHFVSKKIIRACEGKRKERTYLLIQLLLLLLVILRILALLDKNATNATFAFANKQQLSVLIIQKLRFKRHPSQVSEFLLDALRILSRGVECRIDGTWSAWILD